NVLARKWTLQIHAERARGHPQLSAGSQRIPRRRRDATKNTFKEKIMLKNPPCPPFSNDTAIQKVRLAEDGWNSRNPERVALAYTENSRWRNRAEFVNGRQEIVSFLTRKWTRELDYRLIKELWAFTENRIAVRFAYEWHDDSGNWF